MKLPKGFGKNYFTLSAITATTNHITMQKENSRVQFFHQFVPFSELEDDESEPIEDELFLATTAAKCNCYYKKKTKKALSLHPSQKYPPLYFKALNNSISPPKNL